MKNSIENIPIHERPREKVIKYGIEYLSNEELLAVVLRCGTKKYNVIELANLLINKYISISNLINCNYEELILISGIKKAKAIEILAIMEIAKRVQKDKICILKRINNPEDIYNNFAVLIKEEKQEVFMVIFLNIKSNIIKYEKVFIGGVSSSIIDINLIFKKAINYGACKIICVHNHPSGDPTPSNQDIMITRKILEIGRIVDVLLLDHIIIGKEGYISLKKDKYI